MVMAKITSKGQITIPKSVRGSLRLTTGDRVAFIVRGDEAVLKPVTASIDAVFGMLHRKGAPVLSVEQMNNAVKDRFKDSHP